MRRQSVPVLAVAAICFALVSSTAAHAAEPSLVLAEKCSVAPDGTQNYDATFGVTGFPANSDVSGSLEFQLIEPDGSITPGGGFAATVTTDANGSYTNAIGLQGQPSIVTLTVDSEHLPGGTQSKSVRVTCEPPPPSESGPPSKPPATSKPRPKRVKQCKRGRYRRFGFKNQGRCVAYVRRASRNR